MVEEDALGPREEALGDLYTPCVRCGRLFLRRYARLVPPEALGGPEDEIRSEQAEVCEECWRLLTVGEENPPR
jgi:hypothetical protein